MEFQAEINLTTDLGATFLYYPGAEPIGVGRYKKFYSTVATICDQKLEAVYCLFNTLQKLQDIENEENLWKKIKENPGLVRFLGVHKDNEYENLQKVFFVFEKYNGGTLEGIRGSSLKPIEIQKIVGDLFFGLKALHGQEIAHLDLKPDNILLKIQEGQIIGAAITDLGLAREISENKKVYPKNIFKKYATPEYKKYFNKLVREIVRLEKTSNSYIQYSQTQNNDIQNTGSVEDKISSSSNKKIRIDEFCAHDKLIIKPLDKKSFQYDIYSLGRTCCTIDL